MIVLICGSVFFLVDECESVVLSKKYVKLSRFSRQTSTPLLQLRRPAKVTDSTEAGTD